MMGFSTTFATIILLQSVSISTQISCYQCTNRPPTNTKKPPPPCFNFSETPAFQVDCPYSSFCIKKTFSLPLNDKTVVVTIRGCAPQRNMTIGQRNGVSEWITVTAEGIYEEGCTWRDNAEKLKINTEEVCYCKNNLCNGQPKKDSGTDIMGIIVVYNAMKYVRSFR